MQKINFHTHTTFCDGKNTPEELVQKAIEKGFSALGFSGHAYTSFDSRYCMTLDKTKKYRDEIYRLQHIYSDRIKIYCGLEFDYFSDPITEKYDFLIGSVHYVEKSGKLYTIDGKKEYFLTALNAFNNNIYELIKEYYKLVGDLFNKTNADIIGHFDLITKFNEGESYFSTSDPRYLTAAYNAVDELLKTGCTFEINTGAMARGIKNVPYPSENIMQRIKNGGGKFILSSDCHDANNLDYGFDDILKTPVAQCLVDYNKIIK